jgi:hypothetical protein
VLIQQSNRALYRGWTEVHVPLCRDDLLMTCEFLNRPSRGSAHGKMRTEGVPENMDALVAKIGSTGRSRD